MQGPQLINPYVHDAPVPTQRTSAVCSMLRHVLWRCMCMCMCETTAMKRNAVLGQLLCKCTYVCLCVCMGPPFPQVYEDEEDMHLILELCQGGDWFERLINFGRCAATQA